MMNSAIKRRVATRRRLEDSASRDAREDTATLAATAFATGLQWMAIAWSENELHGVAFGHPSRRLAEEAVVRAHRLPRHAVRIMSENDLDDAPQWVLQLIDDL